MTQERWLAIPNFPAYEVSNLGSVRSARGELRPWISTSGYRIVSLRRDGLTRKVPVHRLVLLAFVGAAPGMDARHLSGDKSDNTLANLAWGTRSQNIRDQVRHGRHNNARKAKCPQGHAYTQQNTYLVGNGRRQCITCTKDRAAAAHARKASA